MNDQESGKSMPGYCLHLTDKNIDETVKFYHFLAIDFESSGCEPCSMVVPIINELSGKYKESFIFGRLDVKENPESRKKYNIAVTPSILLFRDGELLREVTGIVNREVIEAQVVHTFKELKTRK